jgi:hypothetical protein
MAPESMVHALEKSNQLLQLHGRLIDIHPLEHPRPIEVRIAGQIHSAGWLQDSEDYIEYVQANEAIAEAVHRGWFASERRETFRYTYHADTIVELRDHLAEHSKHAIVDDLVVMRVTDLMHSVSTDQEVMMHVPVSISRLHPLP